MPKASEAQKQTLDRVMHEFKHGELETADGRKVTNPKQAIAIALHESGASSQGTPAENRRTLRRTKAKEAKGETAQQETEGKSAPAHNRTALYAEAKKRKIPGRSKMNKAQLERALHA